MPYFFDLDQRTGGAFVFSTCRFRHPTGQGPLLLLTYSDIFQHRPFQEELTRDAEMRVRSDKRFREASRESRGPVLFLVGRVWQRRGYQKLLYTWSVCYLVVNWKLETI